MFTNIGVAHSMLAPLVGLLLAPKLFAVALLCCGPNSTVTATTAGQIVMEGFLDIKLAVWARRLIARLIAILPLVMFTRDRAKIGELVAPHLADLVAGVNAAIIIALNVKLLWDIATG